MKRRRFKHHAARFSLLLGFILAGAHLPGGTVAGAELQYDLTVQDGWNLVSLPLDPSPATVGAVFGSLPVGPVWEWAEGRYRALTEDDSLAAGVGYWLYVDAGEAAGDSVSRPITGTSPAAPPASLSAGWNLAGPVGVDGSTPVLLPFKTIPGDSLTGPSWRWKRGGYAPAAEVAFGDGVWVRSQRDATVLLSNAPYFAGAALAYSGAPGEVTVCWPDAVDDATSANDMEYTVYLAPSGTDPLVARQNALLPAEQARHRLTFANLNPDTAYDCVVLAEDQDGHASTTGRPPLTVSPRPEMFSHQKSTIHDLDEDMFGGVEMSPSENTATVGSGAGLDVGHVVVFSNPHGRDIWVIESRESVENGIRLTLGEADLGDVQPNGEMDVRMRLPAPATVPWEDNETAGPFGDAAGTLELEQHPSELEAVPEPVTLPFRGMIAVQEGVDLAYDVRFAPFVNTRAEWQDGTLTNAHFSVSGDLSYAATVLLSSNEQVNIHRDGIDLGRVTHEYRYVLGDVPMRQTVTVALRADVDIESQSEVFAQAGMADARHAEVSANYADGQWQLQSGNAQGEPEVDFALTTPSTLTAQIAVYPVVTTQFYSVDAVELAWKPRLGWDVVHRETPPPEETVAFEGRTRLEASARTGLGILGASAPPEWHAAQELQAPATRFSLPEIREIVASLQAAVGELLTLEAVVTDGVNNPVPDENISWEVVDSPGNAPLLNVAENPRFASLTPVDLGSYTIRCIVDGENEHGLSAPQSAEATFQVVLGNYLIVDLSDGPDAQSYNVSRRMALDDPIPDEYRTTKLVLRRIPAASETFSMGSPKDEKGRFDDETQHPATLSDDFYVGVFEVTQRQWELVMGESVARYAGDPRPVETVSYQEIRGAAEGADWPASRAVDDESFLGKLRSRASLPFLDLPTEAQWEFACRAGTTSALNSGQNLVSPQEDDHLDELGRYYYNSGQLNQHATAGAYSPNDWGVYDMHGNVAEWCLDWYASYPESGQTDPEGPSSGASRVVRGGSFNSPAKECRSAARNGQDPSTRSEEVGFRVASLVLGPPVITSFSPQQGRPGDSVTINGDSFTGTREVAFNGRSAEFGVVSDTRIRATVPANASDGPIRVQTELGGVESEADFAIADPLVPPLFEESAGGWAEDADTVVTDTSLAAVHGDLYLAFVSSKGYQQTAEVSGLGMTWTRVDSQCAGRSQTGVDVWRAEGTPTTSGPVRAILEAPESTVVIAVVRYSRVRADAPVGTVVSANTNGIDGACEGGADSATYGVSVQTAREGNLVVTGVAKRSRDLTAGNDFVLRRDVMAESDDSGNNASVAVVDRVASPLTNVRATGQFSSSVDWAVVAVEIHGSE